MGVGRADKAENGMFKCPEGHIYAIDAMGKKSRAEISEAKVNHYNTTKHEYDIQREYEYAVEGERVQAPDTATPTSMNPYEQIGMTSYLR